MEAGKGPVGVYDCVMAWIVQVVKLHYEGVISFSVGKVSFCLKELNCRASIAIIFLRDLKNETAS